MMKDTSEPPDPHVQEMGNNRARPRSSFHSTITSQFITNNSSFVSNSSPEEVFINSNSTPVKDYASVLSSSPSSIMNNSPSLMSNSQSSMRDIPPIVNNSHSLVTNSHSLANNNPSFVTNTSLILTKRHSLDNISPSMANNSSLMLNKSPYQDRNSPPSPSPSPTCHTSSSPTHSTPSSSPSLASSSPSLASSSSSLASSSPSLASLCSICSSPAASHLHYGAVCCYSCRAFFRRGISENKKCIYNTNNCHINQFNRTNCKKCRYEKCLKFGMKPQLVGAVLKRKQQRTGQDMEKETTKQPINKGIVNKSEKKYFAMEEFPDNSLFLQTIVPNGRGGIETLLEAKTEYIKEGNPKQNYEFKSSQSSTSVSSKCEALSIIEEQPPKFSMESTTPVEEKEDIRENDFKKADEDIKTTPEKSYSDEFIYQMMNRNTPELQQNRILENSTLKRHCQENLNDEEIKPERMFQYQRPIISAYERLKQNAYFGKRNPETITSQNEPEIGKPQTIPTFFSSRQVPTILEEFNNQANSMPKIPVAPNILDEENIRFKEEANYMFGEPNMTIKDSEELRSTNTCSTIVSCTQKQSKPIQVVKPSVVTVRNVDCLANETRPTSIIKYVSSKYDTNLENFDIPIFDNAIEDKNTTTLMEKEAQDIKLKDEESEEKDESTDVMSNSVTAIQPQLISDSDEPLIPLKKRSRMHECYYPITHAINRKVMPVMTFTFEEEFSIVDYMVRIQKYITMQHNFMKKSLGNNLLTTKWVNALQYGHKIPYNQEEEKHLFDLATRLIKAKGVETFPDLKRINNTVRSIMLHSTIPTLWILYLSIIEAHKNSSSGMDQVKQTLYFTNDLYGNNEQSVLTNIRGMSYKDMERFTSPWAENSSDEQKFDRTLSQVGGIMANDIKLHALYHMLVMCIPSKKTPDRFRNDRTLCDLQAGLVGLTYRYLANKPGWSQEKADETLQLLLHLVDQLHDCADIMYNRSLVIQ